MSLKGSGVRLFPLLLSIVLLSAVACGEGIIDASEMTGNVGSEGDDSFEAIEPDPGDAPVDDPPPEDPAEFPPVSGQDFAARGSFDTIRNGQDGPDGAFTLHYPKELGQEGLKHPIITWGNGTGAVPAAYSGLLDHWASHGFVVIASNSGMTGSGEEMLAGVDWLISENDRVGSPFFDSLDTGSVGASGHSQGGAGSIAAGREPQVTCIAPVQPSPSSVEGLQGPMFVIAGSEDTLVTPSMVGRMVYDPSEVPTIFGILAGATHFSVAGSGGDIRGYVTAWFRLHLMGDDSAFELFYSDNCGICTDPEWTVQRKNI